MEDPLDRRTDNTVRLRTTESVQSEDVVRVTLASLVAGGTDTVHACTTVIGIAADRADGTPCDKDLQSLEQSPPAPPPHTHTKWMGVELR